jgi:hypothetical protein
MHEVINFLKGAVDRTDMARVNGCYIIRNGSIYCRNMFMQAGVAMESAADFNVPASALDSALARMKDISSIEVKDNEVVIKSGRLKSTIRLNTEEPPGVPAMPEEWNRTPVQLAHALKLAKPFMGDQGVWQAMRLMTGRVTAMNNQRGIDVFVPELELPGPCLLVPDTIDFIVSQGTPDEYAAQENALCFRWDDGRWLRAQLYVGEMPEGNIVRIFEGAGTAAPIAMDQSFKEAFADVLAMTDESIIVEPHRLIAVKKDVARSEVELEIPGLPEGHSSIWTAKVMEPVIGAAERWNPASWPGVSYFEGTGFRGVCMGRSRL